MTKKIEIEFDEKKHKYYVDGEEIPSVTTILKSVVNKPRLTYWAIARVVDYINDNVKDDIDEDGWNELLINAKKAPDSIKNESAGKGTEVHRWIENYILGKKKKISKENKGYINAFKDWLKHNKGIKLLESEVLVYNNVEGYGAYCGTLDILAEDERGLIVIDIKTSRNMYPEHIMQTSAYQGAYESMTGKKIVARIVLKLGEDGTYNVFLTKEFENDFNAFKSSMRLHKYLKEMEKCLKNLG